MGGRGGDRKGKGPLSWAWLWSQQNEHRLAVPRLMVWLDLYGFGGKNISLFVEIIAGLLPIATRLNFSGGLLIGPAVLVIGWLKRVSTRVIVTFAAIYFATLFVYLWGYHRSATDLRPLSELSYGKDLLGYVLTYFGASWTRLLPHKERIVASTSLIGFIALFVRAVRKREEVSDFEWFLIGECGLTLATALLTAFGRLQFGAGQAFARPLSNASDDLLGCTGLSHITLVL